MNRRSAEEVIVLLQRTRVHGKAVVVNQCDRDSVEQVGDVKIINTTERGLSRSRNMAIANASGDICLVCDDDEILEDDYQDIIINAYQENTDIDFALFILHNHPIRPWQKKQMKFNRRLAFSASSHQITFKRTRVLENHIQFDTRLGSGVSNCGGEENKFCFDCLGAGLKAICFPRYIASLIPDSGSQWWNGYTEKYFVDRAKFSNILLGSFWGKVYSLYFLLNKYKIIKKTTPLTKAAKILLLGRSSTPPHLNNCTSAHCEFDSIWQYFSKERIAA